MPCTRVSGDSALGGFHYVPVLYYAGEHIRRPQRLFLAASAIILSRLQQKEPPCGLAIYGRGCKHTRIAVSSSLPAARTIVAELTDLARQPVPPVFRLCDHCFLCTYRTHCRAVAKDLDHLSLLSHMSDDEINRHNSKGIFTVKQLSYTFRPRAKSKRAKDTTQPHSHALQALAIREGKVYVAKKPELPTTSVQVYLDVEGDADGTSAYLVGALVVTNGTARQYSFWADTPDDEIMVAQQLLALLQSCPDYTLFHYGRYDYRFLERLNKFSTQTAHNLILSRSANVLTIIHSHLYFPTYSNSLKEVAAWLGFSWSDPDASGIQSIAWRATWEKTGEESLKSKVICYNAEDCMALKVLCDHLYAISTQYAAPSPATTSDTPREPVVWVDSMMTNADKKDWNSQWGKARFLLESFDFVNRCAYFDYQRSVIRFRNKSAKNRKRPERTTQGAMRKTVPASRTIVVTARKCPFCKNTEIERDYDHANSKLVYDLKMLSTGIRRVVVRYLVALHKCKTCEKSFLPRRYVKQEPFLHNLKSWAMYQHVANRTTFEHLEGVFKECFGLPVGYRVIHTFKGSIAQLLSFHLQAVVTNHSRRACLAV